MPGCSLKNNLHNLRMHHYKSEKFCGGKTMSIKSSANKNFVTSITYENIFIQ